MYETWKMPEMTTEWEKEGKKKLCFLNHELKNVRKPRATSKDNLFKDFFCFQFFFSIQSFFYCFLFWPQDIKPWLCTWNTRAWNIFLWKIWCNFCFEASLWGFFILMNGRNMERCLRTWNCEWNFNDSHFVDHKRSSFSIANQDQSNFMEMDVYGDQDINDPLPKLRMGSELRRSWEAESFNFSHYF